MEKLISGKRASRGLIILGLALFAILFSQIVAADDNKVEFSKTLALAEQGDTAVTKGTFCSPLRGMPQRDADQEGRLRVLYELWGDRGVRVKFQLGQ